SSGGINDSGAIRFPHLISDPWFWMGETRTVTCKTGFYVGVIDEPIILEAFINSYQNGGYAAVGFSSASSNLAEAKCHILDVPAMGMQFFSSGFSFFNNDEEIIEVYDPDIPLSWYKLNYTIIPRGSDVYDAYYQLWRTNSVNGYNTLLKSGTERFTNTSINDGMIYPYISVDGHRVSYVDNITVTYPEGATLPVTMSSFSATVNSGTMINLQWTTESESNLLGFNVYRSEDEELLHAVKLNANYIESTNSSTFHTYNFPDNEFDPSTYYYYWIESVEMNSTSSFYGPVSVFSGEPGEDVPEYPTEYMTGIESVYPNPFSPNTQIAYRLNSATDVRICIYNHRGQLIRTLLNSAKDSGQYQISWDGNDNNGTPCATGMYIARMQAGEVNSSYKMLLVK
ncbi:MAG: FlgD immunoglobulin-like domain containing protein, partial [Candidatus Cloacimonadota bacterium]